MKLAPKVTIPLLEYYRLAIADPISLRTRIFSEYGDIAWRKLKGINSYNIAHPDYVQQILQDNQDNYLYKHPLLRSLFSPVIGANSLVTTNDLNQWFRDRITANVSFTPAVYFQDYADTIAKLSNKMLENWKISYKNGDYININKEIGLLITAILSRTLFDEKLDIEDYLNTIISTSEILKKKVKIPSFLWYFSPLKKEYYHLLQHIKELANTVVSKRLANNVKYDDLLGQFLQEYKNSPKDEIINLLGNHFVAFIAVGYFTTSALIQWLLVEFSYRPEVERQIAEEVQRVIGDRLPTYKDMASLPYLSLVIKEVLRLHPTNYAILRQAIAADTIGGFYIPEKAGIAIGIYHVHRHPDFWVNPDAFIPERFHNNPVGQAHPFAYIPFSDSKRRCPAAAFSTLEAMLIITMIVQRFRLHLPENANIKPYFTTIISMRPSVKEMKLQYK